MKPCVDEGQPLDSNFLTGTFSLRHDERREQVTWAFVVWALGSVFWGCPFSSLGIFVLATLLSYMRLANPFTFPTSRFVPSIFYEFHFKVVKQEK